jgi:hypothetical protein
VYRVDTATKQAAIAASFEGEHEIMSVALAKQAQGAIVAWQAFDASSSTFLPVMAALLDETGAQTNAAFAVLGTGQKLGQLAVAPFGVGLAVAWFEVQAGAASNLHLSIVDAAGNEVAGTTWVAPAGAIMGGGNLTILAAPDAAHLLVAWDAAPPSPTGFGRVWAARFGCVGGI